MYFGGYWLILIALLVSGLASGKVKRTFRKFDGVRTRSGVTGYETAVKLLRNSNIYDITVGRTGGQLTDHYHPARQTVNLSDSTYGSASVAAVAVAAHEIGHVLQNKTGYGPYRLRTVLVPVVNIGPRLAMPLVLVGLLLDAGVTYGGSDLGYGLAMFGVLLYGLSFLFALVTLPVELNASRRAKEMLWETGILTAEELPGAEQVLSAAAMTYVASMFVSLLYFLRFLFTVLSLFGRRDSRR